VPFCQLQQLQCLHHGIPKLTFVFLCVPFLSPAALVMIGGMRATVSLQSGVFIVLLFAWNGAKSV